MIVRFLAPLSSIRYWFLTCYVIISILSPYIDMMIKKIEKSHFRSFLITLIAIFYLIPTITNVDILGNGGKDVVTLAIVYLIGRYLRYYGFDEILELSYKFRCQYVLEISAVSFCIGSCLINFATDCIKSGGGFYIPFAKDSSILTLIISILILLVFIKHQSNSILINRLASYVIAIYIGEGIVKDFMLRKILSEDIYTGFTVYECLLFVIVVCGICILMEGVRRWIFSRCEDATLNNDKVKKIINIMSLSKG